MPIPTILFCENPLMVNEVDPDYATEYNAAKENGLPILLYNYETLTDADNATRATKAIQPAATMQPVIYRGWMLTPKQYANLYAVLLSKNYPLINNLTQYQNCHYLPDSLKFIKPYTPLTVFQYWNVENSMELLIQKTKVFGSHAVILKDFVKSEKHNWETACFVKDASNKEQLIQSIQNLLELRGTFLNEGIVVREFIDLNYLTIHSKSGMPLMEEYRLFFYQHKLVGIYNYWEEGEYTFDPVNIDLFAELATIIKSNFFSMDIARQKNGEFIIMELGDGQVAGLPDAVDRNAFYASLATIK
jgi:ATP-grasp domain, R2K clade family 2